MLCCVNLGFREIAWHPVVIVPFTNPLLLCLHLRRQKVLDCLDEHCEFLMVGSHTGRGRHLQCSEIWLGDSGHVCRAIHAFVSMINIAIANGLLLTAELLFWYQLSKMRQEWRLMPVNLELLQANGTESNSTDAELQAFRRDLPYTLPAKSNVTNLLFTDFPLSMTMPTWPVFILWLQSFLVVNYSHIRKLDNTVRSFSYI